ncbi:MAG: FAD-dependent oxidoreductase [Spirochaetes bacterium]|nr:FAD-dependent oxidoreductase [Spirochaetota bacterium]
MIKRSRDEKNKYPLRTNGTFIFAGFQPNTNLFNKKLTTDEWGYIKTNEDMLTNMDGIYAAGDICSKKVRQITTAVADGTIAAVDISKKLG